MTIWEKVLEAVSLSVWLVFGAILLVPAGCVALFKDADDNLGENPGSCFQL